LRTHGEQKGNAVPKKFGPTPVHPVAVSIDRRGIVWPDQFDPEFFKGDMDIGMQA
jgi:hypothetical protein